MGESLKFPKSLIFETPPKNVQTGLRAHTDLEKFLNLTLVLEKKRLLSWNFVKSP